MPTARPWRRGQAPQPRSGAPKAPGLTAAITVAAPSSGRLSYQIVRPAPTRRLRPSLHHDLHQLDGHDLEARSRGTRQDAVRRRRRDHRRGQAGSTEAAPGRPLLCSFDCRVRQAQPRSGLRCRQRRPSVSSVADAGCAHQVVTTGSGPKAARTPAFKWVNTALGNIKAAITGTYRAIDRKHVPRYPAEFEYRFNRRYDLAAMIPRLTWAAVRTAPMPYRLLKLAEVYA